VANLLTTKSEINMAQGTDGLKLAADLTKQVITLSTGIVALTMTFAEKLGKQVDSTICIPVTLKISWACLALALLFSVWTLMGITGTLVALDEGRDPNPERSNIKLPSLLMMATFALGLGLVFITGFWAWL